MTIRRTSAVLVAAGSIALCACAAQPRTQRANTAIDPDRYAVACEGAFDQAPRLQSGKVPVYPVSMLNPELIEDRKIRRLPMQWPVESTFTVTPAGLATDVRSTPTVPASFGQHMTIAVRSWRFAPAQAAGTAVPARCRAGFTFLLG